MLYPAVSHGSADAEAPKDGRPAGKKPAAEPFSFPQAKPGDVLASASAPQVGQRAFTLAVSVETTQRDAVIVAQGGLVGYALYLKGGRVVFALRRGADEVVEVLSPEEVRGAFAVTASLAADGAMKLVVAGQPAVSGKANGLLPRQPAEDFCVGGDHGKPVGLYGKPETLRGTITGLSVTLP